MLLPERVWDAISYDKFGVKGGIDAIGIDTKGNVMRSVIEMTHCTRMKRFRI